MPKININTKVQAINVISNIGTELEVDQETLDQWNKALSAWWEVQLQMDKLLQIKARDAV